MHPRGLLCLWDSTLSHYCDALAPRATRSKFKDVAEDEIFER